MSEFRASRKARTVRTAGDAQPITTKSPVELRIIHQLRRVIVAWLLKHIDGCDDPRAHGKGLTGDRSGEWRYRIGDYRLICVIEDDKLVILALSIGHRWDVYQSGD